MCHLHSLVIWSEGDHTMKGDRPQTKWQKDRKYAMKGLRSPVHSTKNQETHSLIIEDNNFCDLQHLHHHHWKMSPSPFFFCFLLELSVKRPHKRRTKKKHKPIRDLWGKKKKWQENKCHKTSVVSTFATISRLGRKTGNTHRATTSHCSLLF